MNNFEQKSKIYEDLAQIASKLALIAENRLPVTPIERDLTLQLLRDAYLNVLQCSQAAAPTIEPEPVQEPPQVVRGLDLFEQASARPFSDDEPLFNTIPTPAQQSEPRREPPPIDPSTSPYLMPSDYAEGNPSAATRFRQGISAVSSGIIKKVRNIPRRVWRMTALVLSVILVLLFIVWCISKLYKATSKPEEAPTAETTPASAGQKAAEGNGQKATPEKGTKHPETQTKSIKLISTGQKDLPDLIRD